MSSNGAPAPYGGSGISGDLHRGRPDPPVLSNAMTPHVPGPSPAPPSMRNPPPPRYAQNTSNRQMVVAPPPPQPGQVMYPPPAKRPPPQQMQQRSADPPAVEDASNNDDDHENDATDSEQFDHEGPPERQHKHSTADMRRGRSGGGGGCGGICNKKYCCIFLMFLVFLAISMFISWLINFIWFSDDEASDEPSVERPLNETFREDKSLVDSACSSSAFDADGGLGCDDLCNPEFFGCCDPFNEFKLYNLSNDPNADPVFDSTNCTLDVHTRGCVSYSKCQASSGVDDPAPAILPSICSNPQLAEDPVACEELCNSAADCCFSTGRNCISSKFELCLDYAPCQNLRQNYYPEVMTAPPDLDRLCLEGDERCGYECNKAKCCSLNETDSCFAENVITCLTYAACTETNLSSTEIVLPAQFSRVEQPPSNLWTLCEATTDDTTAECLNLCESKSACCRSETDSCFVEDPLGCMEWNYQCYFVTQKVF